MRSPAACCTAPRWDDRAGPGSTTHPPTTYVFVPSSVSGDGLGARTHMTSSGACTAGCSTGVSSPSLGSQLNTGDAARERRAFMLALAAMAVVVIVDISVDSYALLIQLLLVGPLIAATGATVRQTLLVSLLAVTVSVPLVAGTDAFG